VARAKPGEWSELPWWFKRIGSVEGWIKGRLVRNPQDALEVAQRIHARVAKKYGPDSYRTVNSLEHVARGMEEAGQPTEALELRREVVAKRQEHQGVDDPATLNSESWLANALMNLGEFADARTHFEHVVSGESHVLGETDPKTMNAMQSLAYVEFRMGRPAAARRILEEVVALYESSGQGSSAAADDARGRLTSITSEPTEADPAE
jgi:hypothetical protein